MRTLAPSGSPIRLRELLACVTAVGKPSADTLRRALCAELGVKHAFLMANGRGAMSLLLRNLADQQTDRERRYVVVPAYTCYSVAASALMAGLDVLVCDIDEDTLCYNQEQLESIDFRQVLAIVSANLYGIPDQLPELEALAKQHGVFLIDDAAQCLGATVGGRRVGTFGDAGILSFDKGKIITSINGGVIVTNNDALAEKLSAAHDELQPLPVATRIAELVKLGVYFALLNPWLYGIPANLPFLKLGATRYEDDYPLQHYFDGLAPLALAQFQRMADINSSRQACAAIYQAQLPRTPMLATINPVTNSEPVWLRFPIRIRDAAAREDFLNNNRNNGCSASYPLSIADVPEIRERIVVQNGVSQGGRTIAGQIVTLPTHAYVSDNDIARICDSLTQLPATTTYAARSS
ncbi:MAG: DegT/DnrJ/EryC1/StrS family aminotransferase [Woeseia sp.]